MNLGVSTHKIKYKNKMVNGKNDFMNVRLDVGREIAAVVQILLVREILEWGK